MDGTLWRGKGIAFVVILVALFAAGCIGASDDVESMDVTREESEEFGTATTLWMEQGMILEDADLSHWHYSQEHATPEEHQANLTEAREKINEIEQTVQETAFRVGPVEELMQESVERAHQVLDGIVACGSDYDCPEAQNARDAFSGTFEDLTDGLLDEMKPENDPRPTTR